MNNLVFCLLAGLLVFGLIPEVFAEIERGKNFNKEIISNNPDGTQTIKFRTSPERISSDGEYWHGYFFSNHDGTLRFESAQTSFEFYDKTSDFKIWSGGMIGQRSPDLPSFTTTLKTATNGTDVWTSYPLVHSSYSYEEIPNGMKINFQQNHNDVILKTIFDTRYHEGLKWTYEISNLSKENSKFGITTVCNDCGELFIDDEGFLNGTWTKEDLMNDDGTYKQIKIKDFVFDPQDYEHSYLWAFKNINGNIVFDFTYSKGVLEIGDTLVIDPSLSIGDTSHGNNWGTATACSSGSYDTGNTGGPTLYSSGVCQNSYYNFDITALHGVTVTSVTFDATYGNSAQTKDCSYYNLSGLGAVDSTTWQESYGAGSAVTMASGDTGCGTSSSAKSVDLTSVGVTELQNDIDATNTYFSLGIYFDSEGDGGGDAVSYSSATIEVIYTSILPPDPITDLSLDSITQTSATLSFTAPDLYGESLINYSFNQTSPWGTPLTFAKNGTSTTVTVTGLTLGTQYSFRGTANTIGGNNATGNILNVTTSTLIVPDAPTLSGVPSNTTNAQFTSSPGASYGNYTVKDYGLRCDLNGAGWVDTVLNSTLTPSRIYDYPGLSLNDSIICQWRDGSLAGWSNWSNSASVLMVITGTIEGETPLNDLNDWIQEQGGIYFGMGIFGIAFILIAVMATPKTVPLFTILLLIFAGILQATDILTLPIWFWGMAIILSIPLVFKRKN